MPRGGFVRPFPRIADQSRTIRIPVHMVENINKLYKVQRRLMQKYNRTPSIDELKRTRNGMKKK